MGRAFVLVMCVVLPVLGKPERPVEKKGKDEVKVVVKWESNWGTVTQEGGVVKIEGHKRWMASGHVRRDGSLFLTWVCLADQKPAPGIYRVDKAGNLVGRWGWWDEVRWLENGELGGRLMEDTIRRLSKE